MARCKGCTKVIKIASSHNMRQWQLCYPCAKIEHPEYYNKRANHGVGGTYLGAARYADMLTVATLATVNT